MPFPSLFSSDRVLEGPVSIHLGLAGSLYQQQPPITKLQTASTISTAPTRPPVEAARACCESAASEVNQATPTAHPECQVAAVPWLTVPQAHWKPEDQRETAYITRDALTGILTIISSSISNNMKYNLFRYHDNSLYQHRQELILCGAFTQKNIAVIHASNLLCNPTFHMNLLWFIIKKFLMGFLL